MAIPHPHRLDSKEVARIVKMLKCTEMNMTEIGKRFEVSANVVSEINVEYKIRTYRNNTHFDVAEV